jgi:hypothetical protein
LFVLALAPVVRLRCGDGSLAEVVAGGVKELTLHDLAALEIESSPELA